MLNIQFMKCRISHLAKSSKYASSGIRQIRLLDYDDFAALQFDSSITNGKGSHNLITNILREGEFIDLEASQTAKYTLTSEDGEYIHTLETFIDSMRHELIASLNLAAKRRKYVVLFRTTNEQYFLFGSNPGAKLFYSSQTDEATGSIIKLSEMSEHPLFEVDKEAATRAAFGTAIGYIPNPENAFCLSENGTASGALQYCYMMKVSAKSGQPLDVDGCLCTLSGKPQAYRKLAGADNLSGNFVQEATFVEKGMIDGTPTYTFDLSGCASETENSISITPSQITIYANNRETVLLNSKKTWTARVSNSAVAKINFTSGLAGNYNIEITGLNAGTCGITFANSQTGEEAVLQVTCLLEVWILQTGVWNDDGRWIDSVVFA